MKELFQQYLQNQVAMALTIFFTIIVGAFIALDGITIKDIVIQITTAVCALVTGQQLEKGKRSIDIASVDKAAIDAAKVEAEKAVETAKN